MNGFQEQPLVVAQGHRAVVKHVGYVIREHNQDQVEQHLKNPALVRQIDEERDERRRTLKERCGLVADLVSHDRPAGVWCHMNDEGDYLEKIIPGSIQVAGRTEDDDKEKAKQLYAQKQSGQLTDQRADRDVIDVEVVSEQRQPVRVRG